MNIARLIYDNYPFAAEMVPVEAAADLKTLYDWAVKAGNFGDSLLKFIIVEAYEAGDQGKGVIDPLFVHQALVRGMEDLTAMVEALGKAIDVDSPASPQ